MDWWGRCWMLDAGCRLEEFGCSFLDAGWQIDRMRWTEPKGQHRRRRAQLGWPLGWLKRCSSSQGAQEGKPVKVRREPGTRARGPDPQRKGRAGTRGGVAGRWRLASAADLRGS